MSQYQKRVDCVDGNIVVRLYWKAYYMKYLDAFFDVDAYFDCGEEDDDEHFVEPEYEDMIDSEEREAEVAQFWFLADGTTAYLQRHHRSGVSAMNEWDVHSPMVPRIGNSILSQWDWVKGNVTDEWESVKGTYIGKSFADMTAAPAAWQSFKAMANLAEDSVLNVFSEKFQRIAQCLKHWGYTELLQDYMNGDQVAERNFHIIKVATRNGYAPTILNNQRQWMEMLEAVREAGGNLQDPRVYMPADIGAVTRDYKQRAFNRRQRERYEQQAAQERRMYDELSTEVETDYHERVQNYLGIRMGNGELELSVLQNVHEFLEEGIIQHHCVFRCGYYEKPDLLVFKCLDRAGNHVSTVSYNVQTKRIVYNLGKCNQTPKQWKEIEDIVYQNVAQLDAAYQKSMADVSAA